MKKAFKPLLALFMVLGVVLGMSGIASATLPTYEHDDWFLQSGNGGGNCIYAHGTIDGQQPAPGTDKLMAGGSTTIRNITTCNPNGPYTPVAANTLAVQVTMNCSWTNDATGVRSGETTDFSGPYVFSAAGTGIAQYQVLWSQYDGGCGYANSGMTPWARVIVKSWVATVYGYVLIGDVTTHWIDPCKFH